MLSLSPTGRLLEEKTRILGELKPIMDADLASINPNGLVADLETLDATLSLVLISIELGDLDLAQRALEILNVARDETRRALLEGAFGPWRSKFHHHRADRLFLAYTGKANRAIANLDDEIDAWTRGQREPRYFLAEPVSVARAELAWIGLRTSELAALADDLWGLRPELNQKDDPRSPHFIFIAAAMLARAETTGVHSRWLWRSPLTIP
jgi:hypothetical protein